jgi:hypothetical protein
MSHRQTVRSVQVISREGVRELTHGFRSLPAALDFAASMMIPANSLVRIYHRGKIEYEFDAFLAWKSMPEGQRVVA